MVAVIDTVAQVGFTEDEVNEMVANGVGFIYVITNKINGKKYIGQAKDYRKRRREHRNDLKGKRHHNKHLQRAWDKYGENSFTFEVIAVVRCSMLDDAEIHYIAHFNSFEQGYNRTTGGDGARGYKHTKESKAKLRQANQGENNPNTLLTDEQREIVYRDTQHTDVYWAEKFGVKRKAVNQVRLGKSGTHVTKRINNEEGFFHSAHLARLEAKEAGVNRSAPKPVAQIDAITGKIIRVWESAYEADCEGCFHNAPISRCCNDKQKTHKGYRWQFYNGEESFYTGEAFVNRTAPKPVAQIDVISGKVMRVWESANKAHREGFNKVAISKCCNGKRKTHGGYRWQFHTQEETAG
ncbi:GIY-YIG nuclease family protein [Priestia aryabhattai]|uniref:GIY-YIG nuclease family protein n=1 Tax=Priestia aryabhattai TaxID=412384 RepID=UPI003D2E0AAA